LPRGRPTSLLKPDASHPASKFCFSLKTKAFLHLFNQAPAGLVLPLSQKALLGMLLATLAGVIWHNPTELAAWVRFVNV